MMALAKKIGFMVVVVLGVLIVLNHVQIPFVNKPAA